MRSMLSGILQTKDLTLMRIESCITGVCSTYNRSSTSDRSSGTKASDDNCKEVLVVYLVLIRTRTPPSEFLSEFLVSVSRSYSSLG